MNLNRKMLKTIGKSSIESICLISKVKINSSKVTTKIYRFFHREKIVLKSRFCLIIYSFSDERFEDTDEDDDNIISWDEYKRAEFDLNDDDEGGDSITSGDEYKRAEFDLDKNPPVKKVVDIFDSNLNGEVNFKGEIFLFVPLFCVSIKIELLIIFRQFFTRRSFKIRKKISKAGCRSVCRKIQTRNCWFERSQYQSFCHQIG